MGAASVTFIATANSLLQLHSSAAMRGRVMALWAIVFLGSTPIGAPLTGYLAAHVGARMTLALAGVATLLAGLGGALALRATRDRLRDEARQRDVDAEARAREATVVVARAQPVPIPPRPAKTHA